MLTEAYFTGAVADNTALIAKAAATDQLIKRISVVVGKVEAAKTVKFYKGTAANPFLSVALSVAGCIEVNFAKNLGEGLRVGVNKDLEYYADSTAVEVSVIVDHVPVPST